jgi:integrase
MRWRTNRDIEALPLPVDTANIRYPHAMVKRLMCTVTKAGARSFAMKRRGSPLYTFGAYPSWNAKQAEEEGKRLNRLYDQGLDPGAERKAKRTAPLFDALCDLTETAHLPTLADTTRADYAWMIRHYARPWLGKKPVAEVTQKEIATKLREIAQSHRYQSNRLRALLSTLFGLAVREGWRGDNPVKGIKPAHEDRRERYLDPQEIAHLVEALQAHPEKISAAAILFLLLTGARRGEALRATWSEFDPDRGIWTKPSANTKQRRQHRIPLSTAAIAVLRDMWVENERLRKEGVITPYVFPSSKRPAQPLTEVKRTWANVRKQAGLADVRLHDLRHSFASALVSGGLNLPAIGALLGHSQPQTTARYSHLYDTTLRDAAEKVGAMVIPLAGRRS